MDSDGDEDFVVSAPTKKVKKNEKADGEEKGKRKKGSATKGDRVSSSPKRKTPKAKKDKEESKKEKEEGKKAKGKGKAKEKEKEKKVEETEEMEVAENVDDGDEDMENFDPNDEDVPLGTPSNADEDEGKSKKKKEKKPTKAKKDKGGARDQDEEEILEYLKKQNRPYSVINIYDNLHAKIKKAACQKALDNLVEEGQLQMKEFGKAKLYLLNQQNIPQVSAKEMDKLKDDMNRAKQTHTKLTEEVKEMQGYLKNLTSQLTNDELEAEIEKYKGLIEEDKKKLAVYESGNYPKISDEDMKKAEEKKKKLETEFKKRKRMCLDMLNSIADFMEQKLTNIMETVGIEGD